MKRKITIATKLILYFTVLLLIFSIAVGSVFAFLFTRQTIQVHKKALEEKAVSIATTLGDFMQGNTGWFGGNGCGQGNGRGGYGAYLKFLDQIAMTDVWIMDQNSNLTVFAHGENTIKYTDLPLDAEKVIAQAMAGETAFSESFSELLGAKSITVGAPIHSFSSEILGVVLLHTPIEGIDTAVVSGLGLFGISIVLALALAIVSAVLLAWHFTRPLRRMKQVAVSLAEGDYNVKTQIVQRDEIGDLAVTLDWMSEKLLEAATESERLQQMRQDFIANISHELRTPVTVLRGSLEALCDQVVSEPAMVMEYHQQMRKDSLYLDRLLNDLLDLSRLQNTDFAIEKTTVNLCDIVQDVARSMQRVAEKKQLYLTVNCEIQLCIVMGDYGRLRQMLLIMADNAVKFSDPEQNVYMELTIQDRHPILSVRNHGIVIPKADIPFIFERFHKSRDERNKTGTGLGLAIAKQIALRHQVEIMVESTAEVTIFSMIFPGVLSEDPESYMANE